MTPDNNPAPNKTILIIDDDPNIQNLLGHLLRRSGYSIMSASNGEEALHLLWKTQPLPALILLDLRMPVMDGWKFRTVQKDDKKLAQIPVVVITSANTVEEDLKSIKVAAFLKKPIQAELLIRTVKDHCS